MKTRHSYISLGLWILTFQLIGFLMGMISREGIDLWYLQLNRSALTPPNYVFPIVWTTLYVLIAIAGWCLWSDKFKSNQDLRIAKLGYILQAALNWSWSPLFFYYHFVGSALICVCLIILSTAMVIYQCYRKILLVRFLLLPYLLWSCLAFYLNLYIWLNN